MKLQIEFVKNLDYCKAPLKRAKKLNSGAKQIERKEKRATGGEEGKKNVE